MSIDRVLARVHPRYFTHLSGASYVRIMDTPRIWGQPFGPEIMPAARKRTKDFERALVEIIQKSKYRCDIASLNSPDPAWAKVILGAMDVALSAKQDRKHRTQFRFLFGQTPMIFKDGTSPNLVDFQGALIRLVRARMGAGAWELPPEIWMGKFFRLQEGLMAGLTARVASVLPSWMGLEGDDEFTKMTWNHSKIVASDGTEALVGGHNLNMDLFTSYPPVHDVSVVMHGEAALGSQRFLDQMWECRKDVLAKEFLDIDKDTLSWKNGDDDDAVTRRPENPLASREASDYRVECYKGFARLHDGSSLAEGSPRLPRPGLEVMAPIFEDSVGIGDMTAEAIRAEDLQTFEDLRTPVFKDKQYSTYGGLGEYRKATRVLSIGKYWNGPDMERNYQKASELMKEELIKGAKTLLRLSQMDLVSAWKKKWSSHVVCHWIMEALLANPKLEVQVVVSPLDAGAGAEGDQYSFGSGASRTFELFQYYMSHAVDSDALLPDADVRVRALERLHIAPFYFTDVPKDKTREGDTYFWPDLTPEGFTATLKQTSLVEDPPSKGVIGSAVESVKKASGAVFPKVPSAPGNHSKIMIVDDASYVVGSDNLYPGFLSEFNYLVEGASAVGDLLRTYWTPLWHYSGQHCVNPRCAGGCKSTSEKATPSSSSLPGLGKGRISDLPLSRKLGSAGHGSPISRPEFFGGRREMPFPSGLGSVRHNSPFRSASFGSPQGAQGAVSASPPLMNPANAGKVSRVDLRAPVDLAEILRLDAENARKGVLERQRLAEEAAAARAAAAKKAEASSSSTSVTTPPPSTSTSSGGTGQAPSSSQASSSSVDPDSNGDKIEGSHFYTDRQILRLMEHYIGRAPNVVVLPGINIYLLNRIAPNAYDDALRGLVADSPPRTIVQPYNVGGNHWGLMFIKVAPPTGGRRGQARVLYIDPLAPAAEPTMLGTLRRPFPDLLVERCLIRYQDDVSGSAKGGQHSCGPWVVHLARRLVESDGALPRAEAGPRQAAIALRAEHQRVLDDLNRDDDDFVLVPGPLAPSSGVLPRPEVPPPTVVTSGGSSEAPKSKDKAVVSEDEDDFVML
ncbi:phospholipase D-like domain-containing protein [Myxococcus qinghaiensis]|uniref:hypothetical protein n=1 Tax=Myxococcus qinghaiensis TaxID=2906758 RepID=UPI0020A70AC8|nr:hypothetical protein [Myxococcus qinghaiensis]